MASLPDWCEPLYDAARMRALDRWAIDERGIPSLQLMERAGEGVVRELERIAPDGPVAVVCGKGNNGGDGLVVARLLRAAARAVSVVCLGQADELSPDARANLERLPGPPPLALEDSVAAEAIGRASVLVDALLGTGFEGSPRGAAASAIYAICAAPGKVVSVDVPSGVDASTGVVAGTAVAADLTATFHAGKLGLWVDPGKRHAGEVVSIDIGIPRGAPVQTEIGLIDAAVLALLPRRSASSTKFSSGHVVLVGGSAGLMGAPAMAALAAMRAGAGYVTACVPDSQRHLLDAQLMEVMTRALADERGALVEAALEPALGAIEKGDALALGPGFGREPGSAALARELARRSELATVIDADALNAHAGRLADLTARRAPTVLTPHAGELGRLLGIESAVVQRERLSRAREAAERSGAIVVLKGDDTLVVDPSGRTAVGRGAVPALATAGTGDVLTGTIAALLAQRLDPFAAAAAAVALHAEAGRLAAREQGSAEGTIATDVIAALPRARRL
ncbi:MAG TPA: NAD(P)H-hydrate dehydratase [Solirubrobacteraceae bacterium]|jgi:NAD(P)H-hydrate epimerase|nr:NAD(P)H-hydrate dehydratase [Solirubrobacteraceae bacterium]